MDSRWYLFPGQTLENTKISDREHVLHITKTSWDGITKHLDRKKLLQEAADKEAAIKKYLDEGSKNMTKGWENSLENVRKRKEEERLQLIEQKKEERQLRFLELRKEQEEIRAKYMEKVKKQIFMTTGHARDLTSALVTSEILYERQKQQEFMSKLIQHEKDENLKYLEIQNRKAKEEMLTEEEKKKKHLEKQKEYGETLKQNIEEKAIQQKAIRDEQVQQEAIDNIEAVKELEKLEKMQIDEKTRKKRELFEERKKYLQKNQEMKNQKIKEDKELDEVIQIYKDAKHRIDCIKQERTQELRDAVLKRREKIAGMVMAEQMDRSEAEEKVIKKAMAEREAAELEKVKSRQEFEAKMKQERLKNREEVLQIEEEKRRKQDEFKKWELLNRYKVDENVRKYEQGKKREMFNKIIKYRQDLGEQMEDVRLEQLREEELEKAFQKSCLEEEDTKFFEYADEVLELAKRKGRTTIPIERVIAKYMKEMNISDKHGHQIDLNKSKTFLNVKKKKSCKCHCPKN